MILKLLLLYDTFCNQNLPLHVFLVSDVHFQNQSLYITLKAAEVIYTITQNGDFCRT